MAINIIEAIQKNLGYPVLKKIDPNNQEIKKGDSEPASGPEKLAQAAIPAVLTAIYKYSRNEDGQDALLSSGDNKDWLNQIYEGNESAAVDKVSHYAGVSSEEAEEHMGKIAIEAVRIIRETAGPNAKPETIKATMNDQRHAILVYLPAAMQLGDLLNDESLDDRTNKMEGPISNLMHSIENKFSGGNDKPKYP